MFKKHDRIYASINLEAMEENFENMYASLSPDTKMIAVEKADAYGHGAVTIARRIQKKEYIWGFAAATVEEAEELRSNGIRKPILVLGYVFPEDYETLAKKDIRPTVFNYEMAEELSEAAAKFNRVLPIHIAVDTGMTRIGFRDPEKSIEELVHIQELSNVKIEGVFTHFSRADEEDIRHTQQQYQKFQDFISRMENAGIQIPFRHCNNSAGILWHREGDMDLVRPGISIYGIYPSEEVHKGDVKLKPVMELKSHVAMIKDVESGVQVSYGGTYVTTKEITKIATIPVGYGDGYPRSLSNKGYVLIHGKKAPILGRICMDQFMVDVTDIPQVQILDEVTLLGKDGEQEISLETLGNLSGRFPYEFTCCLNKRVPRVYKG